MARGIFLTTVLVLGSVALGQSPADADRERYEAAMRRLAERQKVASTRPAAVKPSTTPATAPATQPEARPGHLVWLIDGSGSMKRYADQVAEEIAKAISTMPADRTFGIVVATPNKTAHFNHGLPAPANSQTRQQAYDFLRRIEYTGQDDGFTAAVDLAAKQRPETVWFVSDGSVTDFKRTETLLSKKRGFKVNTVLKYGPAAHTDSEEKQMLRTISASTGGTCIGSDGKPMPPLGPGDKPAAPRQAPAGPSIFND